MNRQMHKRVLSLFLSMVFFFSALSLRPFKINAAGDEIRADALVAISVDEGPAQALTLYADCIYEIGVSLSEGEHTYRLSVDGTEKTGEVSLTVPEDQIVYIRYYAKGSDDPAAENNTADSVNQTSHFKACAAWVGNFAGLESLDITNWDPADEESFLDYQGGGAYSRTFSFPALESELALGDGGYKIAYGGDWSDSPGSNIPLTLPAGTTSVTVYANYLQGIVTDSINEPVLNIYQNGGNVAKPAFSTTVSLIGTVRGGINDWDAAAAGWEFTQISKTLYAYSQVLNEGDYQYKVVFDRQYWYDAGGNKSFSISSDSTNIVYIYDAARQEIYDTVNNYNTVAEILGLQTAPAEAAVINNANGTVEFIIPADEEDEVILHYAYEETPAPIQQVKLFSQLDSNGQFTGAYTTGPLILGDEALNIIYYYTINGIRTLNASAETVPVSGEDYSLYTRAAFTGRAVYVPGTLPGAAWNAASNLMSYLGNGLYSYTAVLPAANYQYKIALNGTWTENYGVNGVRDGSNYALSVYSPTNVTIYYSDYSHLSVTSVNYTFADLQLSGTGLSESKKLTDYNLSGIYTATCSLDPGTYSDYQIEWTDKAGGAQAYALDAFTLENTKQVTFYFDPVTELYYCNASDVKIDGAKVYYNTQDSAYKSIYGAVEQNQAVHFAIDTGTDVKAVYLFTQGPESRRILMAESSLQNGIVSWSADVSFPAYGQYTYYFALSGDSDLKIYSDDDGYYGEGAVTELDVKQPYDLIVYKEGFETPDWVKNAVIYQIFPDRFFNGDTSNDTAQTTSRGAADYERITNWYTWPENPEQAILNPSTYPSQAHSGDGIWSNEIYGGDLKGITKKIDYLKALGVNVIYLNPVFHSISSHRYDATDYLKIDPILGTLGDFTELVEVAEDNGMYVVLDGVFNHVSDDSVYFDRYYKFVGRDGKVGAYPYWAYVYDYLAANTGTNLPQAELAARTYFQSRGVTDFTYTQWFDIYQASMLDTEQEIVTDTTGERIGKPVYNYDGWWGYDSMPVVKSTNGSEYQTEGWPDEIINGADSVTQYWLLQGSDGWRLDVANEVSDETWKEFRRSVKALSAENVIIGEIWDDAVQYLLGDMYDSVMNYVFRNAVLGYVMGGDASDAVRTLERLRERYPKEAFYAMMNLVGSHDTTRLLSYLDGIGDDRAQNDTAHAFPTYAATSSEAKKRQYAVALIQMTYPGAPTIYYGDEIGMVGADDPDDRRAMEWGKGNKQLVEWYAKLAAIRNAYAVLRTGGIEPVSSNSEAVLAYLREDSSGSRILVAANNTGSAVTAALQTDMSGTLKDLLSGSVFSASGGNVTVTIPAFSGVILTAPENVLPVSVNYAALRAAYAAESSGGSGGSGSSGGTETQVTNLVSQLPSTITSGQISDVIHASSVYDSLSDSERGRLSQSTISALQNARNQVAALLHTSGNGTSISGVPWNVGISSTAVSSGHQIWNQVVSHIGGNQLILLYDISLRNYTTDSEYILKNGEKAILTLPFSAAAKYPNLKIVHMKKDGTIEYITPAKIENGKITFEISGFSPIGLINVNDAAAGAGISDSASAVSSANFAIHHGVGSSLILWSIPWFIPFLCLGRKLFTRNLK